MNEQETQLLLLVDDNEEDYTAIMRAFKKVQLRNPVVWCKSGQEALDFLRHEGRFKEGDKPPTPGMILLDLNMPGLDGHQVLKIIKGDDNLKRIPVIILTTSGSERDISSCFQEGANSYVQKPVSFEGMVETLKGLKEYWFDISFLPKEYILQ